MVVLRRISAADALGGRSNLKLLGDRSFDGDKCLVHWGEGDPVLCDVQLAIGEVRGRQRQATTFQQSIMYTC